MTHGIIIRHGFIMFIYLIDTCRSHPVHTETFFQVLLNHPEIRLHYLDPNGHPFGSKSIGTYNLISV